MNWLRHAVVPASILALTVSLAACGDTWHGLKEDTGENMQKTGQALENVGEDIK